MYKTYYDSDLRMVSYAAERLAQKVMRLKKLADEHLQESGAPLTSEIDTADEARAVAVDLVRLTGEIESSARTMESMAAQFGRTAELHAVATRLGCSEGDADETLDVVPVESMDDYDMDVAI